MHYALWVELGLLIKSLHVWCEVSLFSDNMIIQLLSCSENKDNYAHISPLDLLIFRVIYNLITDYVHKVQSGLG